MKRSSRIALALAVCLCSNTLFSQSLFDSIRVARSAEVHFATCEASLSADALTALDTLSAFFLRNRRAEGIRITAHTDSIGTFEKNLALSQQRADSVRAALTRRGVDPQKISIAFFGEKRPVATNDTEEGRLHNRRAMVDVLIKIPMTQLSGQVLDQETGKGVPATVVFSYKNLSDSTITDTAGRYNVRLPANIPVKVDAYAEGYFFESVLRQTFETKAVVEKLVKDNGEIRLQPARPGEMSVLKNFYFEGGRATLLQNSLPQLPKILKFMQINPTLRVEIAGHINMPHWMEGPDPLQPGDLDWNLSDRRAQVVYNYLLEHGIPETRMSWKGYGNSQMVKPNARSEFDQELNRRVEIRVLHDR